MEESDVKLSKVWCEEWAVCVGEVLDGGDASEVGGATTPDCLYMQKNVFFQPHYLGTLDQFLKLLLSSTSVEVRCIHAF